MPARTDHGADISSEELGDRLRAERERRGIGVRELSRLVDVSASMISQIERGKVMPSVTTLYALTQALGLTFDELFPAVNGAAASRGEGASSGGERVSGRDEGAAHTRRARAQPQGAIVGLSASLGRVQRAGTHRKVVLASGVEWELLAGSTEPDVEVLNVRYDVGGESTSADALMRHDGYEYGLVYEGRLAVTVGFETYELGPGDSISFASTTPHRLFNMLEDQATTGLWVVVGRGGDPRADTVRPPSGQQLR